MLVPFSCNYYKYGPHDYWSCASWDIFLSCFCNYILCTWNDLLCYSLFGPAHSHFFRCRTRMLNVLMIKRIFFCDRIFSLYFIFHNFVLHIFNYELFLLEHEPLFLEFHFFYLLLSWLIQKLFSPDFPPSPLNHISPYLGGMGVGTILFKSAFISLSESPAGFGMSFLAFFYSFTFRLAFTYFHKVLPLTAFLQLTKSELSKLAHLHFYFSLLFWNLESWSEGR